MDLSWCGFIYKDKACKLGGASGDHIFEAIQGAGTFYEAELLEQVARLHPEPRLVLDAGANIGNHSVYWGLVAGARVLAVEPSPRLGEILLRNVEANGLQARVSLLPVAAGAAPGQAQFREAPADNLGRGAIVEGGGGSTVQVQVQTLDGLLLELGAASAPDLVKVDVEGYERQVLTGAVLLLGLAAPDLVVELATSEELSWARGFLGAFGYRLFQKLPAWTPTFFFRKNT